MSLSKTGFSNTNLATIFAYEKGYRAINGKAFNPKGKEIKLSDNYKGYPKINVYINRKCFTVPIHKLVAYEKFGHAMFGKGIQVRHLNGNKWDFTFENIEIGTQSDNRRDIPIEQRQESGYKSNLKNRKLSQEQVQKIRNDYLSSSKKWGFITKTSIEYNISLTAAKNLIRGKTYNK
jgi:hypothetical protein